MGAGANERGLPAVPGFQLVRRVGSGGMGEVFHAVRVGPGGFRKTVALKQLVSEQSLRGRARQRFLEEARLTAQLEHANLVRVHDVVATGGSYFIVMELLLGMNLVDAADALRADSGVRWPFALSVAEQAMDGLAYAHQAIGDDGRPLGLVHRDLTPRNVFVCSSGAVKILDFGIAKRTGGPSLTHSGHVHGTIEFLSPEQARGERADHRSDLFQLGATLYWLLSGRFPHGEGTAGELIARAAAGRPDPLGEVVPSLPASVTSLIDRAMAREPGDRFANAAAMGEAVRAALAEAPADARGPGALARALAAIPVPDAQHAAISHTISETGEHTASAPSAPEPAPVPAQAPASRPSVRRWLWGGAALALFAAGVFAGAIVTGPPPARAPTITQAGPPGWRQLTFDRGRLGAARFAPDGSSFVYGAAWDGGPFALYEGVPGNRTGRALGIDDADLLAISADGQMLLMLHPQNAGLLQTYGTLAQAPLAGGGPRELLSGVAEADFAPDGERIAVIRLEPDREWIEFPLGRSLIETRDGWFANLRVAPAGERVAFVDHPAFDDTRGHVTVVEPDGTARRLGDEWASIEGLAWAPSGEEIWVTAARDGGPRQFVAVALDGSERTLASSPINLRLVDVDLAGRALVVSARLEERASGDLRGDGQEHYLPAVAGANPMALSPDGRWLLGSDFAGDSANGDFVIYKMPVDGASAPTRLGVGTPLSFSPDGRWVLARHRLRDRITLVPTGPEQPIDLPLGPAADMTNAVWLPDGRGLLITARPPGAAPRMYTLALDADGHGSTPQPFARPGLGFASDRVIAPDGEHVLANDDAVGNVVLVDLRDGTERPAAGLDRSSAYLGWLPGSREVLVVEPGPRRQVTNVMRVDVVTGTRELWKRWEAIDPSGTDMKLQLTWASPDMLRYIIVQTYLTGTLFEVDGLR